MSEPPDHSWAINPGSSRQNGDAIPAPLNALLEGRFRSRDEHLEIVPVPASRAAHRTRDGEFVAPPLNFRTGNHPSYSLAHQRNFGFLAFQQDDNKLTFAPDSDKIGRAQTVLERLRHYTQNGG